MYNIAYRVLCTVYCLLYCTFSTTTQRGWSFLKDHLLSPLQYTTHPNVYCTIQCSVHGTVYYSVKSSVYCVLSCSFYSIQMPSNWQSWLIPSMPSVNCKYHHIFNSLLKFFFTVQCTFHHTAYCTIHTTPHLTIYFLHNLFLKKLLYMLIPYHR